MTAQVVEIADTVREGKKVRVSQNDGTTEEYADMVERSRLMIDARKWLASKVAPKKYADWRQTAKLLEAKPAQPKDRQGSYRLAGLNLSQVGPQGLAKFEIPVRGAGS